MTTVSCLFVRSECAAEFAYSVDYVRRLRDMAIRWMDRPFRFVCLTDQPKVMPEGVDPITVKKLHGLAPWTKLELFNPARRWTGRMLYLDLDTLIVAPLAPILDVEGSFAITADPPQAHKPRLRDRFGRQIVRRFNSSVMVWDGGTQTSLYTDWTHAVADRLSGDQDWLGEKVADATALPRDWFPRLSELHGQPATAPAKIVLAKVPKNEQAARDYPWFAPLWGAA